jgi:enamine deaminase RidA (YjgF/YER057c/UK114 family)
MSPDAISPPGWGSAYGGFSQGIVVDLGSHRMIYVAGQLALRDGELVGAGDMALQAEVCYERIAEVLAAAGASMADLVETRTYLVDMTRLSEVAAIRHRHLADPPPTSTAIEITALAVPGALIEIAATAVVSRTSSTPAPIGE